MNPLRAQNNGTPIFLPSIARGRNASAPKASVAQQVESERRDGAANPAPATATPSATLSRSEISETLDRIKANQDYQAVLQEALRSLNKALERNRQMQVRSFNCHGLSANFSLMIRLNKCV